MEDALHYLDQVFHSVRQAALNCSFLAQVKAQFGDQPKIYTQFLDIMKNFKAATYVYSSHEFLQLK